MCVFNDSLRDILQIMKVFEMDIAIQSYNFCMEADANCIKYAELSLSDVAKQVRSNLKSARKQTEEENLNLKGQLYGPGIAD